jgi:molybdopterin converting factor small subunit
MLITIKLYSMLRSYLGEHEQGFTEREFPDGAIIADVLAALGIPEKIPKITLINGEQKSPGETLAEGDTLSVFPPMAGG